MALVITLIILGGLLLFAETLLPGMVAGSLGVCCLIGSVVIAYTDLGASGGHLVLLTILFGLGLGTVFWFKYFPSSRLARPYVSTTTIGDIGTTRNELLDQTGVAKTPLRPSGTAVINGENVDVVTEGNLIEPGTPLKVVSVEGLRVVVRTT
jgi:membrane-bound serine protease (ClpP class)